MLIQPREINPQKRDRFITAEINRFVEEFQAIEIRVTPEAAKEHVVVFVHPPYMLQSVALVDDRGRFEQLKERHRMRLRRVKETRESASETIKRFLERQFHTKGGKEKLLASGRAEIAEIKQFLQRAVDRDLISIPMGEEYPSGGDLRAWLKEYGVGVDCSSFVQQALSRVIEGNRVEVGHLENSKFEDDELFLRCGWVYEDIGGNARDGEKAFMEIMSPVQARPGDVVVSRSHMRIVVNIGSVRADGMVFDVAESTSATDIPMGQINEEDDIGPRIINLKYPKPRKPIARQSPLIKRLADDDFEEDKAEREYVIGRYREIEKLWRGA